MPVRPRTLLAAAGIAPALLLTGCGGSDGGSTVAEQPAGTTTTAAAEPTAETTTETTTEATSPAPAGGEVPAAFPCDALTVAEVGAIAGDTYTFKTGPAGGCEYKPADVRGKPDVNVEIPTGEFDLSGVTGAKDVPGLGLSAYVRRDTSFPNVTIARAQLNAAGKVVEVAVTGGDDSTRDATAEKVLRLAFTKL